MNTGISIRILRKKIYPNLTQIEFAELAKISQTYLSQIESGKKTPKIYILERISIALNIPLSIIFWFGLEEKDVPDHKKGSYKILKPTIDSMINEIF